MTATPTRRLHRRRWWCLHVAALVGIGACTYDTPSEPQQNNVPIHDLLFEATVPGGENAGLAGLRLMVYHTDSGRIAPLFGRDIVGGNPAVSADGRRVVYVGPSTGADEYDYQDLWIVARDEAPRRLALAVGPEHDPSLSPNGLRIAYSRPDAAMRSHLYLADLEGHLEMPLALAMAPGLDYTFTRPAWSPDGSQLLFSAGPPGRLHLYMMRADGSQLRQITDAAVSDIDGTWSPDGQTIAFIRTHAPDRQTLMTRHLVTGAERTFEYPGRTRHPAWSPDGTRIAFVSNMSDNADLELYTVGPDGSALTRLTNDALRQQHPRWIRR